MAGANDNAARIARSAALTLVISVAVLYLGDRFGMVGDKKVEASASFTPNKPNGTVELEFTFDATGLEDKEVVAFETLYKDGIEVATHADIDDAAQTVKFVKPPKGGVYDKTGNMLSGYGWVAALLVVAAVAGAGYAGKQYLDARKEKDGDADGGES